MIVDTMTHAEVFREIDKDSGNLIRWVKSHKNVMRRAVMKAHKLPTCFWWEYRSPRNIQYMIGVQAYSHKIYKKTLFAFIALHRGSDGMNAYIFNPPGWEEASRNVITDHAIKRYIERMGMPRDTSLKIGLRNLIENNFEGVYVTNRKAMGRSVRYNGEEYLAACADSGVMLGKRENGIIITKTFITYDMATGMQHEAFTNARTARHERPGVMRTLNRFAAEGYFFDA